MALADDQRPFIVIFLRPSTAGGHKMASLAVFVTAYIGLSRCRQLNCHSSSIPARYELEGASLCEGLLPVPTRLLPYITRVSEYPLLAMIWLTTKTVSLSKVAPLGANRNWPRRDVGTREAGLRFCDCGALRCFSAESRTGFSQPRHQLTVAPSRPSFLLSFPIERTNAVFVRPSFDPAAPRPRFS